MASSYPGSLDSFDSIASEKKTSDRVGGRTHRDMHNDLGDAIEAVQAELGTDPAGASATVKARFDVIEANDWVTAARIAADAVGTSEIAAGAVGTAEIADAAVTAAKLGSDVRIGNLLTANQAGCVSGFESDGTITYGSGSFAVANPWTYIIATVVPAVPGDTYTASAELAVTGGTSAHVTLFWRTSADADISSVNGNTVAAGATGLSQATGVAPPTAAYALLVLYDTGATSVTVSEPGVWRGAGGTWSAPGSPIVGQSPVLISPDGSKFVLAVDNSGALSTVEL